MYIEIADDIISVINDQNHRNYKDVLWFLQEVALCMRRGNHYISIPALRKNINLKNKLRDTFPEMYRLLSQTDDSDSKELKRRLKWHMVVTRKKPDDSAGHILYYNPIYNHNFEIFEETHLICENLYDCSFYHLILQAYKNRHKIPGIIHNYLPRNGGGATTATVVSNEIKRSNHLCLIITDSDRKFKPDPENEGDDKNRGNTFKKIKDVIKDNPYEFLHLHVLGKTREAENLIPHKILLDYTTDNQIKSKAFITYCNTSFFDFKEGLRYNDLNTEIEYLFWKPIMDSLEIDYGKRKHFKEEAKKPDKTYHDLVKDEPPLISGFGNNILSTVISKNRKDIITQDLRSLTPDQREDWEEIGSLMFDWTLSKRYT